MKKIYIDVDGVLADFVSAVAIRTTNPHNWRALPQRLYRKGDQSLHKILGFEDHKSMMSKCDNQIFWETLRPLPDAVSFVHFILTYASQNPCELYFLTTPPEEKYESFFVGRRIWLENFWEHNFPMVEQPKIIFSDRKEDYVEDPDSILLDDYEENVWKWEGCGGKAMLVPTPWNTRNKSESEYVGVLETLINFFDYEI